MSYLFLTGCFYGGLFALLLIAFGVQTFRVRVMKKGLGPIADAHARLSAAAEEFRKAAWEKRYELEHRNGRLRVAASRMHNKIIFLRQKNEYLYQEAKRLAEENALLKRPFVIGMSDEQIQKLSLLINNFRSQTLMPDRLM